MVKSSKNNPKWFESMPPCLKFDHRCECFSWIVIMVLSSSVIISMTLNWMIMCELFQFYTHRPRPPLNYQWGVFGDLLEPPCVGKTISIWRDFVNFTPADHEVVKKRELEIIACDCFLTISDDNQLENWLLNPFPSIYPCFQLTAISPKTLVAILELECRSK